MKWIGSIFLSRRFYALFIFCILLFIVGHFVPFLFQLGIFYFFILAGLLLIDIIILFFKRNGIFAKRTVPEKLSNGDQNQIQIYLENRYSLKTQLTVIDEIPHQFQKRDLQFNLSLDPLQNKVITYALRPVKRGIYSFGSVNVFVKSAIGLIVRRYKYSQNIEVPVYPSFMQMRRYEIMAISRNLQETGIKRIRRIGHNLEFEQIKEYVPGDDYRTINWKATARKSALMVNTYQDERSQQVYAVIDKGRVMKMPFQQMTLLDYAINASLVITNIALRKDDKAGLVTFEHTLDAFLPAAKRKNQINLLMEILYQQKTSFKESDFSVLYQHIRTRIKTRSLILLFTNFESVSALQRQLPYLQKINKAHLLVCIFFSNSELNEMLTKKPSSLEEIYTHTIAEKFDYEKKLIVKELKMHGINAILSEPADLTINTINKYLELKSRSLI